MLINLFIYGNYGIFYNDNFDIYSFVLWLCG
jgi:hypothetical protein